MFSHHSKRILPLLKNSKKLVGCQRLYSSELINPAHDARPMIKTKSISPYVINANDKKYLVGKDYEDFKCIRDEYIPEFGMMSYTFRHNQTGTQLWYLDRNDVNNVFSVNFRTTPFDSTGLPHILEHSVLCGSEKFPVRDPFFKMLNRSVATFMNAMTGADYTLYPFSSMNEIDYRNLQQIYLDAVFRPNLEYLDFLQEGWRLEHSDLKDKQSKYVIKGVVYNEMKGAFSENSSIFGQNLINNILPGHTYGYVSGGNPLEIPKLTHQNLIDFHKKYYHPSNSRIYAYGNFNLSKTLEYINKEYLSCYDPIDDSYSLIPNEKRWSEPRNVHVVSRFDSMGAPFEKQNQISIALLMSDITNISETFELCVVAELLVRGPNSPFYKSLIEPNFSGGYNQTTGYESQIKDTFFCVGLQDLKVEDFDRVQKTFDETIQKVIDCGFDEDHIESVLHNIELMLKHQTPQFGLRILFNATPLWNHDGDVVDYLRVGAQIKKLRARLEVNPKYLQHKVAQYFQSNTHRLTLTMSPDDHYESNFQEAEALLLSSKVSNLSPEDRLQIYENGLKLEESQKAAPNVNILPCLQLDDVKKPPEPYSMFVTKIDNVPTQICTVQTNQISYFKCLFDSSSLNDDEILLIPLFCNIINDMGTKNYDYRLLDKVITSKTSGIDFKLHFAENIYDSKTYNLGVLMTTHALDYNSAKMFELCHELLCNFKIDDIERLNMLIESYISSISTGIASSGHLYALMSCFGLVTDSAKLKSLLGGVEHIEYMKKFVKDTSPEDIMQRLVILGKKLFNAHTMRSAINTSDESLGKIQADYKEFINKLPKTECSPKEYNVNVLPPSCQHFLMNIPVNYCAKAFLTVPYTHRDHPALRVLAKFLSAKYLLPVVREQNGAYGAGAKIGADGIFGFFSYRDPNSRKTLDAFDNTYQWLKNNANEITEQSLFEAKLGVLQQLDSPVSAGNLGSEFFLYGVSQEIFQKYRLRMLNVSMEDLKKVIEEYFKNEPKHHGKILLGPENKNIQKGKENWTVHGHH